MKRHLAGKRPCTETIEEQANQNEAYQELENFNEKVKSNGVRLKCKYCEKELTTSSNRIRHEKVCKIKEDDIYQLEEELGLAHKRSESKTICVFCKKEFVNNGSASRHIKGCKSKETYEKKLKEMSKSSQTANTIVNVNGTLHNGDINNNVTINIFGKEDVSFITADYVAKLCTLAKNDPKLLSFFLQRDIYNNAAKPENKTVSIPTIRSNVAKVNTVEGMQVMPFEPIAKQMLSKGSNLAFRTMANEIMDDTTRGSTVNAMNKEIKDDKKVKGYIEDLRPILSDG